MPRGFIGVLYAIGVTLLTFTPALIFWQWLMDRGLRETEAGWLAAPVAIGTVMLLVRLKTGRWG